MWYQSKMKYLCYDREAGKNKTVAESFLHEGITYGEVEKQLAELLPPRVKDYTYTIAPMKLSDVVFHKDGEHFYKIQVRYTDDEKAFNGYILMPGDTPEEAYTRCEDFLKNCQLDYEICKVDKTDILAVWHPHNEIWQGDFRNRMEDLQARGRKSADANQMSINFDTPDTSVVVVDTDYLELPAKTIRELPPAKKLLGMGAAAAAAFEDVAVVEDEDDGYFWGHYDKALDELRSTLDYEEYQLVKQAVFCREHGVNRSLFRILCEIGALEAALKNNPADPSHFRLTDKINTLRGKDLKPYLNVKD